MEFLLGKLGLNNDQDVFPIYIGDDTTDEDAFKVICSCLKQHAIELTTRSASYILICLRFCGRERMGLGYWFLK